jgi:hypothetical protein
MLFNFPLGHLAVSPQTTGFPIRRLLRLAGITVEVFLPASTRGRHRINTHRTHTNIHASSGIRTHDLSVGAGEDSSCLRPRGHFDQKTWKYMLIPSSFLNNYANTAILAAPLLATCFFHPVDEGHMFLQNVVDCQRTIHITSHSTGLLVTSAVRISNPSLSGRTFHLQDFFL